MNYTDLRLWNARPAFGVLQKLLNRGGSGLTLDGVFGPHTKNAVRAFQRSQHLLVDGIVGRPTGPMVSASAWEGSGSADQRPTF